MRITIVTPGHLASNPRVVKEAETLQQAGHQVSVVHGQSVPWLVKEDASVREPGWLVMPVAYGRRCAGLARHLLQSLVTRLSYWLFALARTDGLRFRLACRACSPVVAGLELACRNIGTDLIIAHYTAGLVAGARSAKQLNVPFAFDAEDYHPGDYPDDQASARMREMIRLIEHTFLPQATYVTTAAPLIAEAYRRDYLIKSTVILNCFPVELAVKAPADSGSLKVPSVYWFSQTIGPNRGLECAVRAIAQSRCRPRLYLRGDLKAGYGQVLTKLARKNGVEDLLHILPVASPGEMVSLCAPYDVGLVGETGETDNRKIALTNKQFTYFLAGLPALMSDVPAHRHFAKEAGPAALLYSVGDAESLAGLFDGLFENPEKLRDRRLSAWNAGQKRYNWAQEAPLLVSLVDRVAVDVHEK